MLSPDMQHIASSRGSSVSQDFVVGLLPLAEEEVEEEARWYLEAVQEGHGECCPGDRGVVGLREEMRGTPLANGTAPGEARSDAETLEHLTEDHRAALATALEWRALELKAKDAALEVARRDLVRVTQEKRTCATLLAKSRQELEDLRKEYAPCADVIGSLRREMAKLQRDLAAKDAALEAARRDLDTLAEEHGREALRAVEAARRDLEALAADDSREALRAARAEASAGEALSHAHDSLGAAFAALSASNDEIHSLREEIDEKTAKAGFATSGVREVLLEVDRVSGDIVETLREIAVCHARSGAAQMMAVRELEEWKLFGRLAVDGRPPGQHDDGREAVIAALQDEVGVLQHSLREEHAVMEQERLALSRFRSIWAAGRQGESPGVDGIGGRADVGTCTHADKDGGSECSLPSLREIRDDNLEDHGEEKLQGQTERWVEKQVCFKGKDPSLGTSHQERAEEPEQGGTSQQADMCVDQALGSVCSEQKLVIQTDPHNNRSTQGSKVDEDRRLCERNVVRGAGDAGGTFCGESGGPEVAPARDSSQTHNGWAILLAEKLLGEIRGAVVEIVVLHAAVEVQGSAPSRLGLRAAAVSPPQPPPTKSHNAAAENIRLRAELDAAILEVQGLERALKASRQESSSWVCAVQPPQILTAPATKRICLGWWRKSHGWVALTDAREAGGAVGRFVTQA